MRRGAKHDAPMRADRKHYIMRGAKIKLCGTQKARIFSALVSYFYPYIIVFRNILYGFWGYECCKNSV